MKEAAVILVLIINATGHGKVEREYEMKSWESCAQAVKSARIEVGPGDENEQVVTMFCAYED